MGAEQWFDTDTAVNFEGAQILNIAGSAAVFAAANNVVGQQVYDIHILSPFGGPMKSMR
jgi:transcriptional regulator GlxA family with amidase domain